MPKTRAQQNKAIRQEALREQLSAQGHVQHAVDIVTKFDERLDKEDQDRLKVKFDMHMKLVDKYLPSLKAIDHTGSIDITDAEHLTDDQLLAHIQSGSGARASQPEGSEDQSSKVH